VHPSTLSRTADRLVLGGWVHRDDNPDNRREVMLALTPKARDLVEAVTSRRTAEVARVLASLPTSQRRAVLKGFSAFAAGAGETDEGDLLLLGIAPGQTASA
jgi:DNA-binding MarR family transcriptional regulator